MTHSHSHRQHQHYKSCKFLITGNHHDCHCETVLYRKGAALALLAFAIAVAGYLFSQSNAVLADGLHSLIDSSDMFISLLVLSVVSRWPNREVRTRHIGALVAFGLLLIAIFGILFSAIHRIYAPERIDGGLMFLSAALGALLNWYVLSISHHTPEHERTSTHAQLHFHAHADLAISLSVIAAAIIIAVSHAYWIDGWIALCVGLYLLWAIAPKSYQRILG